MVDFLLQENKDLVQIACDDEKKYTPLCLAAKGGTHEHISCMNLLCVAGAGIDCTTKSGLTPLQVAVMHGQIQTAKELIRRGANKQILDKHGSTLLHLAAEVGDVALINYLIDDAKLSVNAQDKKGLTPLHKAAHAGKINAVETLLLKGSDPKTLDYQGETALHWGIKHKAVVKKLLSFYELPIKPRVINGKNYGCLINKESFVVFSPDNQTIAIPVNGGKEWLLLDINGRVFIGTLRADDASITSFAFSPDGKTIVSANSYQGIVLYEICTKVKRRIKNIHTSTIHSVVFSHNGLTIVSASNDKSIHLWNSNTGELIQSFEGHSSAVYQAIFSPDNKIIASCSADKTIKLWSRSTGNVIHTLEGHSSSVYQLAFSQNGQTIASVSKDNTIKLWNINAGKIIRTFEGYNFHVYQLAFSHDGKTIASGNENYTVKQWNVESGEPVSTMTGYSLHFNNFALTIDGKTIGGISSYNSLNLWNSMTGQFIQTFTALMGCRKHFTSSADGTMLASGSKNNTIKLWDLRFDTILHQAVRGKNSKVVKMIIEKFPLLPFIRTPQGQSPLELAQELQHTHDDGPAIVDLLKTSIEA